MPVDRGTIEQQLVALGESPHWWEQRELRDLPAALHAGEQILALARGKLARPRWLRWSWLIVVTDGRLLCLQSSARSHRQMEVRAGQITRVALRIGVFRGRILLLAGRDKYRLLVKRADAYKLLNVLSGLVQARDELPSGGYWQTHMFGRVIQHVLDLPAVALNPNEPRRLAPPPAAPREPLEKRIELLEDQVQRLQQQVDFLEQLLQQRELLLNPTHER